MGLVPRTSRLMWGRMKLGHWDDVDGGRWFDAPCATIARGKPRRTRNSGDGNGTPSRSVIDGQAGRENRGAEWMFAAGPQADGCSS